MKRNISTFSLKHERGQSLVELALAVLVLIILVSGIVDLGRVLFYYVTMRDAAQEGLIYGSVNPYQCDEIERRARATMASAGGDVVIDVTMGLDGGPREACEDTFTTHPELLCSGQQIEVTVTEEKFPLTMPVIGALIGTEHIKLSTSVKGTILRPACP